MKAKELLLGFLAGLVIASVTVVLVSPEMFSGDQFSVQVLNQAFAIKTNKRTGETWVFDLESKVWKPIRNSN